MFLFEQFYEQQGAFPPQNNIKQQVISKQKNLLPGEASSEDYEDDSEEYADDSELDSETDEDESSNVLSPDLAPLKRYYLIRRLKELNDQLVNYNIKNDELDIIIKFVNNLSYNSLLLLSNSVIQNIEDQIARLSK